MGITDTSEYGEVSERFLIEYDAGKSVADICSDIIYDYSQEFGEESEILFGVYYALANCQWMCGCVSNAMLQKVCQIIESGADLEYCRSLGADDDLLKLRKRNLCRFYKKLQIPRQTFRRRMNVDSSCSNPVEEYCGISIPFPQVSEGTIVAYPCCGKYRMFMVMDIRHTMQFGDVAFCFVWPECFEIIPDPSILLNTKGISLGTVPGDAFPESFEIVGWIPLRKNFAALIPYAYPLWKTYLCDITTQERFYGDFPMQLCLNLQTVINKIENLMNDIR